MMRKSILLSIALASSGPLGATDAPGRPGAPQVNDMVIAHCYASRGQQKRLWDLAKEIDATNKAIAQAETATPRDEGRLSSQKFMREDLWRRYVGLGGRAEKAEEALALTPDPCADVKETIAKSQAGAKP